MNSKLRSLESRIEELEREIGPLEEHIDELERDYFAKRLKLAKLKDELMDLIAESVREDGEYARRIAKTKRRI